MDIMAIYQRAIEVIEQNHSAVVVFTHGKFFRFDSNGNGITGKWVVNPERLEEVDQVIIYLRMDGTSVNRIFLGNYMGSQPSDLPRFQNMGSFQQ